MLLGEQLEEVDELGLGPGYRLVDSLSLLGRGEVRAEEEDLQVAVVGDRVGELAELIAHLVELVAVFGDLEQGVGIDPGDLLHYRPSAPVCVA